MLSRIDIVAAAEAAREKHWPGGEIPVEIDLIIERTGIVIVPSPGLRDIGMDACISADYSTIYLDRVHFTNERMNARARFSLAHEMGHVILHSKIFEEFRKSESEGILDWARHIRERVLTGPMEREADEFAGCFLVPKVALQLRFNALFPSVREHFQRQGLDALITSPRTLYSYMANQLCREFEVSAKVVEIRLERIAALANYLQAPE